MVVVSLVVIVVAIVAFIVMKKKRKWSNRVNSYFTIQKLKQNFKDWYQKLEASAINFSHIFLFMYHFKDWFQEPLIIKIFCISKTLWCFVSLIGFTGNHFLLHEPFLHWRKWWIFIERKHNMSRAFVLNHSHVYGRKLYRFGEIPFQSYFFLIITCQI